MTPDETAKVLTVIHGAYPAHPIPEETVALWANAFAQTDYGMMRRALGRWIEDQSFPPTVADLNHQMRDERARQAREIQYTSRRDYWEQTVPISEGKQIARRAYIADCEKRGFEPSLDYFDKAIGIVKADDDRRSVCGNRLAATIGLQDVDPWDIHRDARLYNGPHPVVAHPPCSTWGQLASVNQARWGKMIGDDEGCFEAALNTVRRFGGVLEHPADSVAWQRFIPAPPDPRIMDTVIQRPRNLHRSVTGRLRARSPQTHMALRGRGGTNEVGLVRTASPVRRRCGRQLGAVSRSPHDVRHPGHPAERFVTSCSNMARSVR